MTPTVKNLTEDRKPGDKSNFTARYIEVDVLVPGNAAVAYYYLLAHTHSVGLLKMISYKS